MTDFFILINLPSNKSAANLIKELNKVMCKSAEYYTAQLFTKLADSQLYDDMANSTSVLSDDVTHMVYLIY